MILFWIFYLVLSVLISFLISSLFNKRIYAILSFSFSMSIFLSIWFKYPGEVFLAPVLSIFLLENTIIENNGILRLVRPVILSFFIIFIISFFLWKKNIKN